MSNKDGARVCFFGNSRMDWFGEVLLKTFGLFVFGLFFTAASCYGSGIEPKDCHFRNGALLCLFLSVISASYSRQ
jgi:hypothetical protein